MQYFRSINGDKNIGRSVTFAWFQVSLQSQKLDEINQDLFTQRQTNFLITLVSSRENRSFPAVHLPFIILLDSMRQDHAPRNTQLL